MMSHWGMFSPLGETRISHSSFSLRRSVHRHSLPPLADTLTTLWSNSCTNTSVTAQSKAVLAKMKDYKQVRFEDLKVPIKVPQNVDASTQEYILWQRQRQEAVHEAKVKRVSGMNKRNVEEIDKLRKIIETQKSRLSTLEDQQREHVILIKELESSLKEEKASHATLKRKARHMADAQADKEKKCEARNAQLIKAYEKTIAKQKKSYTEQIQQLKADKMKLKDDLEGELTRLKNYVQEKETLFSNTVSEKEEKITNLTQTLKETSDQLKRSAEEKTVALRIKADENRNLMASYEEKHRARLRNLQDTVRENGQKLFDKDKEFKELEEQKKKLCKANAGMRHTIATLNKKIKKQEKVILDEKAKMEHTEAKFRHATEELDIARQKISYDAEIYEKNKAELKSAKETILNLNQKMKNLQFRITTHQPTVDKLKAKIASFDFERRDFRASLEACKSVLEEPRSLKKKVSAMIRYFVYKHKIEVDLSQEQINADLLGRLWEKDKHLEKIEEHHRNEMKQAARAWEHEKQLERKEKFLCVDFINEQKEKHGLREQKGTQVEDRSLERELTATKPSLQATEITKPQKRGSEAAKTHGTRKNTTRAQLTKQPTKNGLQTTKPSLQPPKTSTQTSLNKQQPAKTYLHLTRNSLQPTKTISQSNITRSQPTRTSSQSNINKVQPTKTISQPSRTSSQPSKSSVQPPKTNTTKGPAKTSSKGPVKTTRNTR